VPGLPGAYTGVVILAAFLVGLVFSLAGLVFVVLRGVELWRQGKKTGKAFSAELALFDERSLRTEQLLAEAERASRDLDAAKERLRISRAQLQVLLGSIDTARERTRWLRVFLPAR
jgi:hypothetical protein